MDWVINNWGIITVTAGFILSEIMPFIKNKKAKGVMHFVMLLLVKGKNIENPK